MASSPRQNGCRQAALHKGPSQPVTSSGRSSNRWRFKPQDTASTSPSVGVGPTFDSSSMVDSRAFRSRHRGQDRADPIIRSVFRFSAHLLDLFTDRYKNLCYFPPPMAIARGYLRSRAVICGKTAPLPKADIAVTGLMFGFVPTESKKPLTTGRFTGCE
jgi:hypothetical protein